jgi:retron-type reverse transcriptase
VNEADQFYAAALNWQLIQSVSFKALSREGIYGKSKENQKRKAIYLFSERWHQARF